MAERGRRRRDHVPERDIRDFEMDEMRRQVQELQQKVERYEGREEEDDEEIGSRDEQVSQVDSQYSSESSPTRRHHRHHHRPRHHGYHRRHQDLDIKVEVPEFEGRMNPDDFLEWLHTVERVFEVKACSDEHKVKIVAYKLKKYASLWWENLKKQRKRDGRSNIRKWETMKRELKNRFLPESYRMDIFTKLHNHKQLNLSAEEYIMEFEHLMLKCDLVEPEEQTIARYLGGLREELSHAVKRQPFRSYGDVQQITLVVEKQLRDKGKSSHQVAQRDGITIKEQGQPLRKSTPLVTPKPPYHADSGSSSKPYGPSNASPRKCFKCQGYGHIAADCPNRRVVSLVEEVEESHQGPNPNVEDDWLRENIFHTKCTAYGKICSVIISGGSCANLIATKMVDTLQLATRDHPAPYKFQWFRKGNEIEVTKQCLVQFSVGKKYKDEVECDVVPMDACHILLGRPWQFDRSVVHDGYKNTYSFTKDGHHLELIPLNPALVNQSKVVRSNDKLSGTQIRRAVVAKQPGYALVVMEKDELESDPTTCHPFVQPWEDGTNSLAMAKKKK